MKKILEGLVVYYKMLAILAGYENVPIQIVQNGQKYLINSQHK